VARAVDAIARHSTRGRRPPACTVPKHARDATEGKISANVHGANPAIITYHIYNYNPKSIFKRSQLSFRKPLGKPQQMCDFLSDTQLLLKTGHKMDGNKKRLHRSICSTMDYLYTFLRSKTSTKIIYYTFAPGSPSESLLKKEDCCAGHFYLFLAKSRIPF